MANVLVVGPHPDDQELGMGGTIALLADQGHDCLLLDVTDGEPTPHGDRQTRLKEAQAARLALGSGSAAGTGSRGVIRRLLLDLPNRSVEHTLAHRHAMAAVIRAHQASIIFVPYFEDAHPDHRAVTRIVEDARFDAKLTKLDLTLPLAVMEGIRDGGAATGQIGPPIYPKWLIYYYATHLRIVPQPSFIMDVSSTLERKMASIAAYKSQFDVNEKNRQVVEWVRAQALYFGSRIGTKAGEPFFTPEPMGLGGFKDLV